LYRLLIELVDYQVDQAVDSQRPGGLASDWHRIELARSAVVAVVPRVTAASQTAHNAKEAAVKKTGETVEAAKETAATAQEKAGEATQEAAKQATGIIGTVENTVSNAVSAVAGAVVAGATAAKDAVLPTESSDHTETVL